MKPVKVYISPNEIEEINFNSPYEFITKFWDLILRKTGKTFEEINIVNVHDYVIPRDVLITAYDKLLNFGVESLYLGLQYFPDSIN